MDEVFIGMRRDALEHAALLTDDAALSPESVASHMSGLTYTKGESAALRPSGPAPCPAALRPAALRPCGPLAARLSRERVQRETRVSQYLMASPTTH